MIPLINLKSRTTNSGGFSLSDILIMGDWRITPCIEYLLFEVFVQILNATAPPNDSPYTKIFLFFKSSEEDVMTLSR